MSCITSTERARIIASINTKQAQLDAVNAAYSNSLTNSEIEKYSFDSGEGKQSTTRRKPEELAKEINRLESEINRLYRRLNGGGIVNLNLRRKSFVRR